MATLKMAWLTLKTTVVVSLFLLDAAMASNATYPYGCSDSSGVYSCDYRFALDVSMTASDFNPPPQQLIIYNVDGMINAANLMDFNLVNTSRFDSNYDASLTLVCQQGGGHLELDSTSFTYMSFYKTLHISNCIIDNIPASAFVALGDLNYLDIAGGKIEASDPNAMAGVTIQKDFTSVNPRGELSITNVEFASGTFDPSLLTPQNDVSVLSLSGSQINAIDRTYLEGKTSLTTLYLDNNNFSSIPEGLFSGLKALSTLSMRGIKWDCNCFTLWWMKFSADNGIRIVSESICDQPSAYQGQRAASYHESMCATGFNCDGGSMAAMNLANVTCVTYLQLFIYILAIIAFFGLSALLYVYIKTRRNLARNGGGFGGGGAARRSSSNRVQQSRHNPPGINKGGWS